MKRFACVLTALMGVLVLAESACADWGSLFYGGYQPWWNIFAKRNRYLTPEEERLQRFWHDYYDSMRRYYGMLDRIDWVAYYKNHGYQINAGNCGPCGGNSRVQFAPVFVSPNMQWAIPSSCFGGAPGCAPGGGGGMPGGPMPIGMGFGGPIGGALGGAPIMSGPMMGGPIAPPPGYGMIPPQQ